MAVSHPLSRGCRFAFVQARLRHVFCLRTGALFFSFRGSKGATSAPCEGPFFASPELGFRWCLAVSHPLSRGCRFAFVQARLRHVFSLRSGAFFFSFRGSKGATSAPCEGPFFASPELAVFVQARLRHVFCLVLGLSSSPLGVPKVPLRPLAKVRFLLRLSSDLGGVWLFRIHCPEAAVLPLSRLGCVTFFV